MVQAGTPIVTAKAHGRPGWAGPVQVKSRQRPLSPEQAAHTVEFAGLVLAGSQPSAAAPGRGLGFPSFADHLPGMQPEMLKSLSRFEQVVREAAHRVQGTSALERAGTTGRAVAAGAPEQALHLRLHARAVRSTRQADLGRLLRPQVVSGELSRVFAIRDVSGTRLRFESAGAAASFTMTSGSTHWSRDPRQL